MILPCVLVTNSVLQIQVTSLNLYPREGGRATFCCKVPRLCPLACPWLYRNPVHTSQETFLFRGTVSVYCDNHTGPTNTRFWILKQALRPLALSVFASVMACSLTGGHVLQDNLGSYYTWAVFYCYFFGLSHVHPEDGSNKLFRNVCKNLAEYTWNLCGSIKYDVVRSGPVTKVAVSLKATASTSAVMLTQRSLGGQISFTKDNVVEVRTWTFQSCTAIKNTWSYTSSLLCVLMAWCFETYTIMRTTRIQWCRSW
jgi:hypothetical protein